MMRPFDGIRVLDFSQVISGPTATQLLAQGGAEVIKIEPPRGDMLRSMMDIPETVGSMLSPVFVALNHGKTSRLVDLKSEAGREAIRALAATVDVVVENFRPGVASRLGIGPEVFQAFRADIVYCSISGFGQGGPLSGRPAFDSSIQAASGMMSTTGTAETGPLRVLYSPVDSATGLAAAFAIAAALFRRQRCGKGQVIDVAMLDAAFWLQAATLPSVLAGGKEPGLLGNRSPNDVLTGNVFETGDGHLLLTAMSRRQGCLALAVLGLEEGLWDRYCEARDKAPEIAAACLRALRERFLSESSEFWIAKLSAAGVPVEEVRSLGEAIDLAETAGRGNIATMSRADGSALRTLGPLYKADEGGPESGASIPEWPPL